MADKKVDENLDLGEEKAQGSKKMIIMIALGGVLLLLAGVGISYFLFAGGGDEPVEGEEEVVEEAAPMPAIYHALEPVFVVNLPPGSKAKMLQMGVQVMSRDQTVIDLVKSNDPMVRHTLLNLFGGQESGKLQGREGKEALQIEVLKSLNKIVKEQEGTGEVEAVFFTSFVMQ